jgi:membrane dipeptidase
MRQGCVSGQVLAIWVDPKGIAPDDYAAFVQRTIDASDSLFRDAAADLCLALTPDEFRRAVASGRIAAVLGVEGGHALEGRLENLERFRKRGVRVFTVTWCNSNDLADSSSDKNQPHGGLSELGREAVKLMNQLGVIIDVSHAAKTTVLQIAELSSVPVIASHSGIKALRDFNRNLSDDEIKAIAAGGGVIGVVFLPYFLKEPEAQASVDDVINCLDHICQLVGPDHAGLGSDFDGFEGSLLGLEDTSKMPAIEAGLRRRGYAEADISRILGLNFLRVWDAVHSARTH